MSKRTKDETEQALANLKYGEAKERLEAILHDLEHQEVDVDDLAAKVKEAAALIRLLNDKLTRTETEIERVLKEAKPETPPANAPDAQAPPGRGERTAGDGAVDDGGAPF